MTKKTKYEKNETETSKATFSADEVFAFAKANAFKLHAVHLQKMMQRPQNPRLDSEGSEILSPISLVADVDMHPLSTRENISRFTKMPSVLENQDGYDSETDIDSEGRPILDDRDYWVTDRTDNPPSPHELKAYHLEKRLTKARLESQKQLDERRAAGDPPTNKDLQDLEGKKLPEKLKKTPPQKERKSDPDEFYHKG